MKDVLPQSHWASYALGLGSRVRITRNMRGLTQARLAELAGVSRSLVSNLERNDYNGSRAADPTVSTVYRLASALQVPPATLLPGVGEQVAGPYSGPELGDLGGEVVLEAALRVAVAQWPSCPRDTAPFDAAYLQCGAPPQVPAFQPSLFDQAAVGQ